MLMLKKTQKFFSTKKEIDNTKSIVDRNLQFELPMYIVLCIGKYISWSLILIQYANSEIDTYTYVHIPSPNFWKLSFEV